MPLYKLSNHYGGAIIGGENKRHALEQLKRHEDHRHNGTHVSLGIPEDKLVEISPETMGVILYFSND